MADTHEGTDNGVNGAQAKLTRDQFHAQDKAAFLAEIPDDEPEQPGKPAAAPKKAAAPVEDDEDDATDAEPEDADEVSLDDDDDGDVDLDDDADVEDADEDAEPEKPATGDAAKLRDQARKREQRHREQVAKDRKALDDERNAFVAEWKPKVEAAQAFEKLKAKGVTPYSLVDLVSTLGMGEDDYEEAARVLFAASPKGKADPKNREAVSRSQRERERDAELAELKKKIAAREEAETKAAEQAKNQRAYDAYMDGVVKVAGKSAGTLAAHYLEKNPERTRLELGKLAVKLAERDRREPSARQVLAAYEKAKAKRLRDDGIDPSTIAKAAPAKLAAKPAATTINVPKSGEKTNAGKADIPSRADIIRELESGDLS